MDVLYKSKNMSSIVNQLDFALRVCESTAFCLHAILALTEPYTGCLRNAFRDRGKKGGMPEWFWPLAGILLLVVAWCNFSKSNLVVLGTQAYIVAFHSGAVLYHLTLEHHPLAGCAPSVFVVMAYIIMVIRTNVLVSTLISGVCVAAAYGLARILVYRPIKENEQSTSQTYLLNN